MDAPDQISVLYIDDELNNLNSFKAVLRTSFTVYLASSAEQGRALLEKELIHIIVVDQRMPGMTGLDFLESIIPCFPDPIRILLTGYVDFAAVVAAINQGQVYKYIQKPWVADDLVIQLKKAYEVYALRKQKDELIEKLTLANKQLNFLLRQNLFS